MENLVSQAPLLFVLPQLFFDPLYKFPVTAVGFKGTTAPFRAQQVLGYGTIKALLLIPKLVPAQGRHAAALVKMGVADINAAPAVRPEGMISNFDG